MKKSAFLRRAGAALTGVALIAGVLVLTPSADAVQATTTSRLAGTNRFSTAVAVAEAAYPTGSDDVVLATGLNFADALAATGLAGALDAPILLSLTDALPGETAASIEKLDPSTVHIIGGTAAISSDVETALDSAGYDTPRYDGASRFETAAAVAAAIDATDDSNPATTGDGIGTSDNGRTAIVTAGLSFPDAVAGSQLAFGGRFPILLTGTGAVPQATLDALEARNIAHVIIVGGTVAVSDAAKAEIEAVVDTTQRIAGTTRWGTSAAVGAYAEDELDFGGSTLYLATGLEFADALGGGVIAGKAKSVLLLTASTVVAPETKSFIETRASAIDEIVALGGTGAISDTTLEAAAAAAKLNSNQVYEVSPPEARSLAPSSNFSNDAGRFAYTVSGLEPSTTFDIALFDFAVVTGESTFSFTSHTLSSVASTSIETVAGGANTAPAGSSNERKQAEGTSTADGTLTFTIDSTSPDSVRPVVWKDEDGDNKLGLSGSTPTEPFGVGGRASWLPPEAADGVYRGSNSNPDPSADFNQVSVTSVNRELEYFIAGGRTFYYSSGDILLACRRDAIGTGCSGAGTSTGSPTLAQFEGLLTAGDTLEVEYFADSQSQFNVVSDAMADIGTATAASIKLNADNSEQVQISFAATNQPDVKYQIEVFASPSTSNEFKPGAVIGTFTSSPAEFKIGPFTGETLAGGYRFKIRPYGDFTKVEDRRNTLPTSSDFRTNEVVVGLGFVGMTEGLTVALNTNLTAAGDGDIWWYTFSQAIKINNSPTASLTLKIDETTSRTYKNDGSQSTWTVNGNTLVITLGPGAGNFAYSASGATLTELIGVQNLSGTAVTSDNLKDTKLEHNGPELMPESSTCDTGETVCAITFNEPVETATAEDPSNYVMGPAPSPNSVGSATLQADGRTVVFEFTNQADGVAANGTIRPNKAPTPVGVRDTGGTASVQVAFDFVHPGVGYP